ncbi:alpha-N-acetylglucosaminidase [Hysterangium stoloniferum]|nr:alpha-N-acetylglucosaminidase [Hysterangium stoloniferum]
MPSNKVSNIQTTPSDRRFCSVSYSLSVSQSARSFAVDITGSLDGIHALVKRRIPSHANSFKSELVDGDNDSFILADSKSNAHQPTSTIDIKCISVSACARGLYFGNVDIHWTGSHLDQLAKHLPRIGKPIKASSIVPYKYYFNTVTFSYTTAFYDFDQWSLLLDWMVLPGINLPLSWVGYEFILVDVFQEIGLSEADISSFLSSPAFLAWNHFGNIHGRWGGNWTLPQQWGFVPCGITNLYPNLKVVNGSAWSGFPSNLTNDRFMDPFEDIFEQIQKSFITKQIAAYGNFSHIYTLDYLRNVSSNTLAFFSDSAFWNLDRISAYLGGAPTGLLILDLYTEAQPQWQRTSSYFGRPWVWCALHDYGGNKGFEAPIEALNSPNSSMRGFGLTMEGQEGIEMIYDIFLDQAWSSSPLNISRYVSSWVGRRYRIPKLPVTVQRAWSILSNTATVKSILELAPALTGLTNCTGHHPTTIFYDTNSSIVVPLKLMVEASKEHPALKRIPEFSYDVVDLGRQLLANRFLEAYQHLVAVYQANGSTPDAVSAASQPLLTILCDLDTLLWMNVNFLLSNWIKAAHGWGASSNDSQYADYLEYNARNQITLWGPDREFNDYASKQWAGIVGPYYFPRWTMFTTYLKNTTQTVQPFDSQVINAQLLVFRKQWDSQIWGQRNGETWVARGDTWKTVGIAVAR